MTEAQRELQTALTTTFLANLAFLSEYDNELYHRVDELSRMIESGTYKEKYSLEFVMEDGDFDIYDVVNDKYLYNKKPTKINNDLIKKIELDEKSSILDVEEHFLAKYKDLPKLDRTNRFEFEYLGQFNTLTLNDTCEYSKATGDFLENRKKRLKKVKKFIFIGTLLGRHIPKIAQKVDSDMYLVLERNLEIFRLSLFTIDYTILGNNGAIFCIMDNTLNTEQKIAKFLNINNLENYLLKFSTTSINIEEYVDNILNVLHALNPVGYDYNRKLYAHINRVTKYIKSGYRNILFNKTKDSVNIFKNTPVLYLAAGPSLDENMSWVKQNQNKFFIVTIGAAYKKLLSNNVRIDMIVTLDEQYAILNDKQFDDESVSKIDKNTIILASTLTNEKILNKFNPKNLFLYEVFNTIHKDNIAFDGFSVGEITLNILLHLNAKNIYLLGLDLALNQKTGDTHSKDSASGTTNLNLEKEQSRDTFNSRESLVKVKGNHCDFVYTTPLFFTSIKSVESKVWRKSKDVEIFNFSTHGAYFEGTIPKKIEDMDVSSFENIFIKASELNSILNKNSTKKLSIQSQDFIKQEINFMQKEIKEALEDIQNNDYKTFEELFIDMYSIPSILIENNFHLFYQCIVNYFQIIAPYLLYHFNDKKVKNEEKKVKKIKTIFINQIQNLIEDYLICLKRVID
ncbi:hypothetical protein AAW30_01147 [Arcobacter porcinus]|uniref:motility associated factor glycosyltransferase family protein n=1 Tax=Arcobacter porcinus TaxID=1935204 RepID=UPI0008267B24|nr:6-hydroxymethylpterin diphosphokinase MptE-like protein [Arcobacter porcinus]OCL83073.1 hypothetical protein AAW30_01147 [Arcobacter porcinus]